jgi:transmembrane sensor
LVKHTDMSYEKYSIDDFVADESFQRWVTGSHAEDMLQWDNWIASHPHKKETIEEARRLVLLMNFKSHSLPDTQISGLWQQMERRIEQKENAGVKQRQPPRVVPLYSRNWYKVAAVLVGFLLISSWYFFFSGLYNITRYTTRYGEVKTILLPDGSSVVLNANSEFSYRNGWNERPDSREVWLDGEAYFSVTHTKNHRKFIVHTSDVQVEVLGTTFNVNNRRNTTKVVLHSGKVKLEVPLPGQGDYTKNKAIVMKPGEMVEFSKEKKELSLETVNPELYTSWRKNMLVFNQASLLEIAHTLEDTYGLTVIVEDTALLGREFTASYPADDLDILFKALSKAFGVQISQEGNRVFLKREINK